MVKHALALAALIVMSILSLFVGVVDLAPADLWHDPSKREVFLTSRAPRLFAVLITGASLALAGCVMQMLVRNRFVDPMTVGTGQGAALGILLATVFMPAATIFIKMTFAALTAFATSLGFLLIARRLPVTQPLLIALVGIIYGGVIGACVTFVAYQADLLQFIDIWMNGEFSGVLQGRYELLWIAAFCTVLVYCAADQFSVLGLGETAAINLGLNYRKTMLLGLVSVSLVGALTVATVGLIPFIGLIVPNIVSRLYGENLRRTFPLIAVMGAGLVLSADLLARTIRAPYEVPVGSVLGCAGSILFLWLLYRPGRHVH